MPLGGCMLNVVLMGIQGSGKGTQARMLSKSHSLVHINIGATFRANIREKTELGNKIKEFIDAGKLVPDDIVFEVINDVFHKDCKGFILDGFPRNTKQAEYLTEHYHIDRLFFFKLKVEEAVKRLNSRRICPKCRSDYNLLSKPPIKNGICDKCGSELVIRHDDNVEAIKKRLDLFDRKTRPLLKYFREKNNLVIIDASQTPEEVHKIIVDNLPKV